MSAHSRIGASAMHRWAVCPASVRQLEGYTQPSSVYADEGTRAHELAASILLAMIAGKKFERPADLDDDFWDAVQVYVDYVWAEYNYFDRKRKNAERTLLLIEHQCDLSSIYPGAFGTADAIVYHPWTKILHVVDYKHGAGTYVEVANNKQLRYYALGALIELGKLGHAVDKVVSTIVQPRFIAAEPIRSHEYEPLELLDFSADLIEAAKRTEDPNAPYVTGDHCRFCDPNCPALKEESMALAKLEFSPVLSYDPDALSAVLSKIPAMEAWIKNVREFAYGEALHGRVPPGWKLVDKKANRKWKAGITHDDVFVLFPGKAYHDVVEEKMKSVAQVEKTIPKEERSKLETLYSKESSGTTLVPGDDPREAISNDAASDFELLL